MELKKALEIVSLLGEGKDPFTGEIFPAESVYQHPDTVRALFEAKTVLEKAAQSEARRGRLPENTGKKWEQEEVDLLLEQFEAGTGIPELAKLLKRTQGGIRSRLELLGKLTPTDG